MNNRKFQKKIPCFSLLASFLLFRSIICAESSPAGLWKTIDEKSGQARSIVQIWIENNELKGKVVRSFPKPGELENQLCTKCPGELKNKPIIGMQFMWQFKKNGNRWENGKILDPETGRIYDCTLELDETGNRLRVFGFVKIIVKIGRSQIWERVQSSGETN